MTKKTSKNNKTGKTGPSASHDGAPAGKKGGRKPAAPRPAWLPDNLQHGPSKGARGKPKAAPAG
ncbi:hypothetical protein, partial [Lysobacter enzymogenes]|uniref:hypothetical protein n=1 Tax=Lysobacter enzymogenes TaxID=69 RepID=UPI0019D0E46A